MITRTFSHSKKIHLITLGAAAALNASILLRLFNDPEGPNLLVVTMATAIVYFLSLPMYLFKAPTSGHSRLWLTILLQMAIAAAFYFLLS